MKVDSTKIYYLQIKRALTGNELAALCGITPCALSRIKKNESTRITTARTLAYVLGVPLEEIAKKEQRRFIEDQEGQEHEHNSH